MGKILEGKPVAMKIKEEVMEDVKKLKEGGVQPTLLLIRVGNDSSDILYEKSIVKRCEELGIKALSDSQPEDVSQKTLIGRIKYANQDPDIHGIMIFRPFPKHLDESEVLNSIDPKKDVDSVTDSVMAKVYNAETDIYPCTPKAVVDMIDFYEIPVISKNVVVVGRSKVVGKPLAMMLLERNATVTICHSKTANLSEITKNADLVVAAMGRPKILTKDYFSEHSIAIDVGVSYSEEDKKYYGDCDFENIKDFVEASSPPTGGVGAITTMNLLRNAIIACKKQI